MLKRIAIIDDIVSFGKCSLNIALPVLSASNCEVYPAITSVFSAHTPIKNFTKLHTKQIFEDSIKNWKNQNVKFDAIYTGALSEKKQAYNCMELFTEQPKAIKIVDPVLGENGQYYDTTFKTLLPHIKLMCAKADLISPNLTEAQFLSGTKETEPNKLLIALKKLGAKRVVLTGIIEGNKISNYLLNVDGSLHVSTGDYYQATIHGAGDTFLSSLIAAILNGKSYNNAIDFATKITSEAVALTVKEKGYERKGILFEPMLKRYTNL